MELLERDQPAAGATSFTRQQAPLGLGHAVWCARDIVGDEPFAVLLPDELVLNTPRLPEADDRCGKRSRRRRPTCSRSRKCRWSACISTASSASARPRARPSRSSSMVEKPPREKAPSNLSITGRYILQPEIFKILETQERGAGGEIQLTDGMVGLVEIAEILWHALRRRAARLRLESRLPARQHRLRPAPARAGGRPARRDAALSQELVSSTSMQRIVMPGLVPGIHAIGRGRVVHGRDKPSHDERRGIARFSLRRAPSRKPGRRSSREWSWRRAPHEAAQSLRCATRRPRCEVRRRWTH